jgi:hypothetical protein
MREISIAFWTYVTPMMATRAMRIGLLLFAMTLGGLVLLFLGGLFSESLRTAALLGTRHVLVMVGLPVAAAVLGEVSLRDGIQHRTLLYPLLGPVPRVTLALVRTAVTAAVLALALTLLLLLVGLLLGDLRNFLAHEAAAAALGAAAYVGMFGLLHLLLRHGLIGGLALLFLVDLPLGQVPFAIRSLSPSYHVAVIARQQIDISLPIPLAAPESSAALSAAVLIVLAAASLAATALVFRRRNLGEIC